MKKFTHTSPDHCDPPGAFVDIIAHPFDKINKAIEKVVIKEHRFAFFYWMKWYRELIKKGRISNPPLLVTIDYHRDLVFSEGEEDDLNNVPDYNLSDLALFCWAKMNPLNDGHILSAAYLNIIGDIVLLKRQGGFDDTSEKPFIDKFGNKHNIVEFTDVSKFEKHLLNRKEEQVFFDIDLDYFITEEGVFTERDSWVMMEESKIKEIINLDRPFIKWVLQYLEGYIIATEPDYCGGIYKSCKILTTIEEQLFTKNGEWKL